MAECDPERGPGFRPLLGDPDRQGAEPPRCIRRGRDKQVRDKLPQLETGIYWDDPQCRLMGGGGWLEGTEGVERGDEVVTVCSYEEVYWGGSWVP